MREYDVIVVGAGPAGAAAAKEAAQRGARTIILEEHPEIGVPAHCCGVVSYPVERITRELLGTMDQHAILRTYRAVRMYAPSGKIIRDFSLPENTVFLVDRALFDKELVRQAVNAGADLLINTKSTGFLKKDGNIIGVTAHSATNPEIYGKVVIGADGIKALQKGVPNWAGLTPPDQTYWGGISFELTRVKDLDPDTFEVHFGAFIKSGDTGIIPRDAVSCMVHFETMEEFRNVRDSNYVISDKLRDAVPIRMIGYRHSWDLGERLPKVVDDNLILTGSSGNWRGTMISYNTGICAGQAAAEGIISGDVTEDNLSSRYEDLLSSRIPDDGYQFKSKVEAFSFSDRSDAEIEDLLAEMVEKGTLKTPFE